MLNSFPSNVKVSFPSLCALLKALSKEDFSLAVNLLYAQSPPPITRAALPAPLICSVVLKACVRSFPTTTPRSSAVLPGDFSSTPESLSNFLLAALLVLLAALIGGITLARKDEALVDEDQV